MTRSTCRARRDERVEPCCSTSSTQLTARHVERVVSCRDVTWRAKSCKFYVWVSGSRVHTTKLFFIYTGLYGPHNRNKTVIKLKQNSFETVLFQFRLSLISVLFQLCRHLYHVRHIEIKNVKTYANAFINDFVNVVVIYQIFCAVHPIETFV